MGQRLIVAGSRNFNDYDYVRRHLKMITDYREVDTIIQGGCKGVDSLALRFSIEFGIPCETVPANWKRHGKAAGPIRNTEMLKKGDSVVLF